MNVFIHLQYGDANENACKKFLKKIGDSLGRDYLIIIADPLLEKVEVGERVVKIKSDNVYKEFSGWEAGLHFLRNEGFSVDGVVFSNDTILKHRAIDGVAFNGFVKGILTYQNNDVPILFGHIDRIEAPPPYWGGSDQREYISTFLMYVNGPGFKKIQSFIPNNDVNQLFETLIGSESVLMNPTLYACREYLLWLEKLLYLENDGLKWYGHTALNASNFEFMKLKLLSIIIEHQISQTFVLNGGILKDWNDFICRNSIQKFIYFIMKIKIFLYKRMKTKTFPFSLLNPFIKR